MHSLLRCASCSAASAAGLASIWLTLAFDVLLNPICHPLPNSLPLELPSFLGTWCLQGNLSRSTFPDGVDVR